MALDLPGAVREAIAAWRDALFDEQQQLRRVDPEQLHVTLVFLGWQEKEAGEEIAARTFDVAAGLSAPVLRPAGLKAVPPRSPRLFALDLEDEGGRASDLHARVSSSLEALGAYRPEKRPFWPHITLARVRRGTQFTLSTEEVSNVNDVAPRGPFEASTLTLYRSTLRPQGALYEPLARITLGGGAL